MKRALTTTERKALVQFKSTLLPIVGNKLVSLRLFGSRAREEGTPESDIDILIVLREKDPAICRRIVEAALDCDLAYGTNLSPTILTTKEYDKNREYGTPFYRNVEQDAVSL